MLFLPTRGAVGMLPIISIVTQPSAALDANAAPSSVPYYNDSRSEFNKNRISTKRFKSRQTAANRQMTRRENGIPSRIGSSDNRTCPERRFAPRV